MSLYKFKKSQIIFVLLGWWKSKSIFKRFLLSVCIVCLMHSENRFSCAHVCVRSLQFSFLFLLYLMGRGGEGEGPLKNELLKYCFCRAAPGISWVCLNLILDARISFVRPPPPTVTLVLPPLDSETVWTGELWSNSFLLILDN